MLAADEVVRSRKQVKSVKICIFSVDEHTGKHGSTHQIFVPVDSECGVCGYVLSDRLPMPVPNAHVYYYSLHGTSQRKKRAG